MPSTPEKHLYEYTIVRYVPDAERGEGLNVGLVMMCKRRRWIKARTLVDEQRISAVFPGADTAMLRAQLRGLGEVAAARGPIGEFEVHERFRWLSAARSATIRTCGPHPGLCTDLEATFERLFGRLVSLPGTDRQDG